MEKLNQDDENSYSIHIIKHKISARMRTFITLIPTLSGGGNLSDFD